MTIIMQTMMKPVCEEDGLGSPPEPFTTNASETVNSIIKSHVSYKPSQLMELTEKLREAIDEQEREVERAVIQPCKNRWQHLKVCWLWEQYCKPPVPPYDLCIQHREWRSFTSPGGGPQSKFSPSYYHVNLQCIRRNWPLFSPRHLIISPEMSSKLTPVHKEFLASFGYVF